MPNKKHLLVLCLFFSLTNLVAQEWLTDFTAAKKLAAVDNKPIILVFQGSDWCAPCIKLDRDIWQSEAFKKYAAQHYVMLLADFPRKKKNALSDAQTAANALLAEAYNPKGNFPLVVVLDAAGKVLGKTGYKKTSPEKYIASLNTFIQ